jgi:hypothetical protein
MAAYCFKLFVERPVLLKLDYLIKTGPSPTISDNRDLTTTQVSNEELQRPSHIPGEGWWAMLEHL